VVIRPLPRDVGHPPSRTQTSTNEYDGMKKPTHRIEEQQPRNIQRADIAPEQGYAMLADGRFKTQFRKRVLPRRQQQNCFPSIQCCKSKSTMLGGNPEQESCRAKPSMKSAGNFSGAGWYDQFFVPQVQQAAACNAAFKPTAGKWLLRMHDLVGDRVRS
jgi:hypothetical protein